MIKNGPPFGLQSNAHTKMTDRHQGEIKTDIFFLSIIHFFHFTIILLINFSLCTLNIFNTFK